MITAPCVEPDTLCQTQRRFFLHSILVDKSLSSGADKIRLVKVVRIVVTHTHPCTACFYDDPLYEKLSLTTHELLNTWIAGTFLVT